MGRPSIPITQYEPADDTPLMGGQNQEFEQTRPRKNSNIGFENFYHRGGQDGDISQRSMSFVPPSANGANPNEEQKRQAS